MLVETHDEAWAFEQLSCIDPGYPHLIRAERGWPDYEGKTLNLLVDDLARPQVVALHHGAHFFMLGEQAAFPAVLVDLYHGRIQQDSGWPDAGAYAHWDALGKRHLSLELPGMQPYETARSLGFHVEERYREATGAYFYYTSGEPRFAAEVKHDCRVVEGLELYELMRTGVDYDREGTYIKRCLEAGPSFVCEANGEPVCWSCTHLNRCLGMIYTPLQHRRKGYAHSLAAFQIDAMLRLDGAANCYVLAWNMASQGMLDALGITRCPSPLVWRTVFWSAPRRIRRKHVHMLLKD